MCGIMGIAGARGQSLVEALLGELQHRGPDDQGIWSSPELTLGHRRLTVIGLDPDGAQPRLSRSGRSVLVFNGEIYNYLELARELEGAGRPVDLRFDTSVLLEALELWGLDALARFNGMFAFAWYRLDEKRLVLARDRWGKKPLFFGRVRLDDGSRPLVFASELRIFRGLPGGPPTASALGVARYLVYDGMPGEQTVYEGVEKVPAAHAVEIDLTTGQERRHCYWTFPQDELRISASEASEAVQGALDRSLDLRLRSDVPVGLFLSGGIDSSLLATSWRRLRPAEEIQTFTVGFDDPSYDERSPASQVAELVGARHHELILSGRDLETELDAVWDHLSEPFSDPSILPVSCLCRHARRHVTVALGGDGADELQAGYDPFRAWLPAAILSRALPRGPLQAVGRLVENRLPVDDRNMSFRFKVRHFTQGLGHDPNERVQAWLAPFPPREALAVMNRDLAAQVSLEEVLAPTRAAFDALAGRGPLWAQIHVWIKTYLESSILTKVDRAGMMHSLEVRAPFLDPDLAQLLCRLPAQLVFRRNRGKVLLRRLARERLPPAIVKRKKKGLGVPQGSWLRSILRERFEDCLTSDAARSWFHVEPIQKLWRAHLEGETDARRALWCFLFAFPFQHRI